VASFFKQFESAFERCRAQRDDGAAGRLWPCRCRMGNEE